MSDKTHTEIRERDTGAEVGGGYLAQMPSDNDALVKVCAQAMKDRHDLLAVIDAKDTELDAVRRENVRLTEAIKDIAGQRDKWGHNAEGFYAITEYAANVLEDNPNE